METTPSPTRAAPRRLRSILAFSSAVLFLVFVVTGLLGWRAGPPEPPRFQLPLSISDVVIVRGDGGDRVVERASADRQSPTYEVNFMTRTTSTVSRTFGFDSGGTGLDGSARPKLSLGLFRMSLQSQYSLFAHRLYGQVGTRQEHEVIPEELVGRWRGLIVDYLNRNRNGERVGDALESVLSAPRSQVWWFCWQNVCVAAAWLCLPASLILGLACLGAILFGPRGQPAPQAA